MQTARVAFFSKKNRILRILCMFGWLAVLINPDKWSSVLMGTVHATAIPDNLNRKYKFDFQVTVHRDKSL